MSLEQQIERTIQILSEGKHDPREVLRAFAATVVPEGQPTVNRCAGCGQRNALCPTCFAKRQAGQVVANLLFPPAGPR